MSKLDNDKEEGLLNSRETSPLYKSPFDWDLVEGHRAFHNTSHFGIVVSSYSWENSSLPIPPVAGHTRRKST